MASPARPTTAMPGTSGLSDTSSPSGKSGLSLALASATSDRAVPAAHRWVALDGLRGVAALAVLVFHFLSAFAPWVLVDWAATPPAWARTPVSLLFNGGLAVAVFFVLSGFVIAGSSTRPRPYLVRDMLLRYLRLALPAAASTMLAWVWLSAWPDSARALADHLPGVWLSYTVQTPVPSIRAALVDGLWHPFLHGGSVFNNVLWTMRHELLGSLALYVCFKFCRRRRVLLMLALCGLALLAPIPRAYVCFSLGALLHLAHAGGWRPARLWVWAGCLLAVVLATPWTGQAAWWPLLSPLLSYLPSWLAARQPLDALVWLNPLPASLLVAGALYLPHARIALASRPVAWLGRISFPLYLVHVPLIYSMTAAAALHWNAISGPALAALFLAYLLLSLTLAAVFEHLVDRPVLSLLDQIKRVWRSR